MKIHFRIEIYNSMTVVLFIGAVAIFVADAIIY